MRSEVFHAQDGALSNGLGLIREALVEKWEQTVGLQVGVEMRPAANHTHAISPVVLARAQMGGVVERVVLLLLVLDLLRLLVQDVQRDQSRLPHVGIFLS